MAFDVGAGLSLLGQSVAQTAQALTIDQQKAELQKQAVILADQLTGARQDKQNTFELAKQDKLLAANSSENSLNRASELERTKMNNATTLQAAGISAGATLEGHRMALQGIKMQLDALEPQRTATVEGQKIENESKKIMLGARSDYLTALDSGDMDAQTKAIQKLAGIQFNPKDQYTEASLYQTQARLFEQALTSAQTKLATLQSNPMTSMTPEGKSAIAGLQKQVNYLQGQFTSAIASAKDALGRVPNYGGRGGAQSGNRPPLSSFGGPQASSTLAPLPGLITSQGQSLLNGIQDNP